MCWRKKFNICILFLFILQLKYYIIHNPKKIIKKLNKIKRLIKNDLKKNLKK